MLNALKRFLGLSDDDDAGGETGIDEARVCATALLVEAALADGIYADIEEERIRQLVSSTFGLSEDKARRLLDEAEGLAEQAVDHHRFTKVVKKLPLAQREQIVEGLWRVVFADGEESPFEEAFVRKVAALLAVDDRASRLARQRASGGG